MVVDATICAYSGSAQDVLFVGIWPAMAARRPTRARSKHRRQLQPSQPAASSHRGGRRPRQDKQERSCCAVRSLLALYISSCVLPQLRPFPPGLALPARDQRDLHGLSRAPVTEPKEPLTVKEPYAPSLHLWLAVAPPFARSALAARGLR